MSKHQRRQVTAKSRSKGRSRVVQEWRLRLDATTWMLILILILAAGLRLYRLDQMPPGLHFDEAPNAWNAYCLLKTGSDQYGVRWPVFYLRAYGDNRSTLYAYALLPFQAIGGLSVWTTRLPGALGGILTVFLIYWVGARLFGRAAGVVAAALLSVNPWHLQQCRWGHEASLVPLLILAPIACMIWANLPPSEAAVGQTRPLIAGLAGLLAGVGCYGYPAVRFCLPLLMMLAFLVTSGQWWKLLKSRHDRKAVGAFWLIFLLILIPLVWKHLHDPAINKRAQTTWVWSEADSFAQKSIKVAQRYSGHFGLDFLFLRGDRDVALSPPPHVGLFLWDSLVWMVLGLTILVRTMRASPSSRFLAVWLLVYPAGDLLSRHDSLHALRSLPGVGALILLSALGIMEAWNWVKPRLRGKAQISIMAVGLIIAALNVHFLVSFFTRLYSSPDKRRVPYMEDLLEASRWLKPRLNSVNAVFCTSIHMVHPYVYTLIGLEYDPAQWLLDSRSIVSGPLAGGAYANEEECLSYGKIHFMIGESFVSELQRISSNEHSNRVFFIVRPGELGLEAKGRPTQVFRNRLGQETLWVFEGQL